MVAGERQNLARSSAGVECVAHHELTERTDFLRSFRTLLPSSRFALSRLCPKVSRDFRSSFHVNPLSNSFCNISQYSQHSDQPSTPAHAINSLVPQFDFDDIKPHTFTPRPHTAYIIRSIEDDVVRTQSLRSDTGCKAWRMHTQKHLRKCSSISR